METVRTPPERFDELPGYPFDPNYVEVDGTRLHYVDEGEEDADETYLLLHGEPSWSYLYRKMIPPLADDGRALALDLPGFGRSDKWTRQEDYTFDALMGAVEGFLEALDLDGVTLVAQDWGGILGLTAAAENPERFRRLVPMNTGLPDGTQPMPDEWKQFRDFVAASEELPIGYMIDQGCYTSLSDEVKAAYDAPFPDAEHQAGALELPLLVPTSPDDDGAERVRRAREAFEDWDKPTFVLFSEDDPITGPPAAKVLRSQIPVSQEQPEVYVEDAAHFLQEDAGERIAEHVLEFVERT
ncbi:MAG: haloalkane dehalogenase [Halobacteriota archaeon]